MANMRHSGGIVDAVLELGFDQVKYFEGPIGLVAVGFSISPPARRVMVSNRNTSGNVYLRVRSPSTPTSGPEAWAPVQASVSFSPGNNIKISPGGSFLMDFDAVTEISLIADTDPVNIEGLLGFKGTAT